MNDIMRAYENPFTSEWNKVRAGSATVWTLYTQTHMDQQHADKEPTVRWEGSALYGAARAQVRRAARPQRILASAPKDHRRWSCACSFR